MTEEKTRNEERRMFWEERGKEKGGRDWGEKKRRERRERVGEEGESGKNYDEAKVMGQFNRTSESGLCLMIFLRFSAHMYF